MPFRNKYEKANINLFVILGLAVKELMRDQYLFH